MMTALAFVLLLSVICALLLEHLIRPRGLNLLQRQLSTFFLSVLSVILLFGLLCLVLRRPWFVFSVLFSVQMLLVLVNQAKFHSLREVFIFQDFEYFTDAIKHPRLYLPFFGVIRTIVATAGFVAAVYVACV